MAGLLDDLFSLVSPAAPSRAPVGQLDEQTARTMLAQKAQPRPDFNPGISGQQVIGAILKGLGGVAAPLGDVVLQSGDNERQAAVKNETYNWLLTQKDPQTGQQLAPEMAKLIVTNKDVATQYLPRILGTAKAPELSTIKGSYGEETQAYWNPQTRKFEPVSSLMGGQGPMPEQKATQMTQGGVQTAEGNGPGMSAIAAPAPVSVAPSGPDMPALGTKQDAGGGFVVGRSVPKPPDGYVHKMAPGSSGFLWNKDGTPVFESKAEADARAKGTEKRAIEQVDKDEQTLGVSNLIANARNMVNSPNFDQGLKMALYSTDLPYIGQVNPVSGIGKIFDRQNPALPVSDDIQNLQSQLNLIVGRAYLKGQGQVSNFERSMVSDAIGKLGSATSKADFLMRLNSVEQMLFDMNSGKKLTNSGQYDRRPTQQEIDDLFEERPDGLVHYQGTLDALSKKYKVDPQSILQYAENIYRYNKRSDGGAEVDKASGNQPEPVSGARQAPDGNWYVADPSRPGKYLRVTP